MFKRFFSCFCLIALISLVGCGGGGNEDSPSASGAVIPLAIAGADQNVKTTSTVILDGSESACQEGALLQFFWAILSKPEGSQAALSSAFEVKPKFIADKDGVYIVALIVNDGSSESLEDLVTITASSDNSAPVANAGANQIVSTASQVYLDGSASTDADNDPLSFKWSFVSKPIGSEVVLSNSATANPTFVPDVVGEYVLRLVVNDGNIDSAEKMITVTATIVNAAPVADAGSDKSVVTGELVTLNGSGSSDPNGEQVTYLWSFVSKPSGSTATLSDTAAATPTFTADLDGDYVVNLVVNDGFSDSQIDSVVITATTSEPQGVSLWPYNLSFISEATDSDLDGLADSSRTYQFIYNTSGKIEFWKADGELREEFIYNADGNLVRIENHSPYSYDYSYSFSYDDNGFMLESQPEGLIDTKWNYFYNENGFTSEILKQYGISRHLVEYQSTMDGQYISYIEREDLDGDGVFDLIDNQYNYSYDANGKLTEYNNDGHTIWTYHYDEYSRISDVEVKSIDMVNPEAIIQLYYNGTTLERAVLNADEDGDGTIDFTKTFVFSFNQNGMPEAPFGYVYPLWSNLKVNFIAEILEGLYVDGFGL